MPTEEKEAPNVYRDLNFPDAEAMKRKAQLVLAINNTIKARRLTQTKAAEIIGLSQPRLSEVLRGRFRVISEAKLLEALTRLGHDVQIVISPRSVKHGKKSHATHQGRMEVVLA